MFRLMPWRKREHGLEGEYPLARAHNDFRTLVERMFGGFPAPLEPYLENAERYWNVEMKENEKEVMVRAEVPGFEPADFHIEVRDNTLMLKAEHKTEAKVPNEEKEKKGFEVERELFYERYVTLPTAVDPEKVEAKYRNGVLELHLPKVKAEVAKRIPVTT